MSLTTTSNFNTFFFKNNNVLRAYLHYKFLNGDISYNNLLYDYGNNTGYDCSLSNPYMASNGNCDFINVNNLPNDLANNNIITQYTSPEVNSYNPSYILYTFTKSDTITFPYDCSAEVLIVGGGGAGGHGQTGGIRVGGGGGGGSVGMGTLLFEKNVKYNITVGDGGIKGTSGTDWNYNNGKDSSVIGGTITEIAYGGGGGIISNNTYDSFKINTGSQIYYPGNGGSGGGAGGTKYENPLSFKAGISIKYISNNGINYYVNNGGD